MAGKKDVALRRGLPGNINAERFVLGSILLDHKRFVEVYGGVSKDHFVLEKHRRIFSRMADIYERGEKIDRVTLANELMRYGELESVDGLSYIVSLDDGLPAIANIDEYIRIVRDKAALREIAIAAQNLMNLALEDKDDPDTLIAKGGESILRIGESRLQSDFSTPTGIIRETEGGINAFLDPSKKAKGVKTGFNKYDGMTGGLHDGELTIIGARPSQGKTSLLLNIGTCVALKQKLPIAIFSLEMTKGSLLNRMACAHARVDSHRFRFGQLEEDERRRLRAAVQELAEADIYIDDGSGTTIAEVKAKLLRLRRSLEREGKKMGMAGLDYIQLMKQPGRQENRVQEVSAISRGLKLTAKDIGCPIVALSQLNRASEQRKGGDGRPQLGDLRESGAIEQDADIVAFIFREEVYKKDRPELKGKAELILAKAREGPTGLVPLVFRHALTRFENPAEEGQFE